MSADRGEPDGASRPHLPSAGTAPLAHATIPNQAAAIPYRFDEQGRLQVLMIRRAGRRSWGIPKGFIEPGSLAPQTAATEAYEEAGLIGELSAEPVGRFAYAKRLGECLVVVYLLKVGKEKSNYPESGVRRRAWFSLKDALRLPMRDSLHALLTQLPRWIHTPDSPPPAPPPTR